MKSKFLIAVLSAALVRASSVFAGSPVPQTAPLFTGHGAPTDGEDCVQTLTFDNNITGGTFKLKFGALVSGSIAWSSNDTTLGANVQSALRALQTIGSAGVTTSVEDMDEGGHGDMAVTFDGPKTARLVVPALTVQQNALIGSTHTLTVAVNVPGVTADGRSSRVGALWMDCDTGKSYCNIGAPPFCDWVTTQQHGVEAVISIASGASPTINWSSGTTASITHDSTGVYTVSFSPSLSSSVYSFVANASAGIVEVVSRTSSSCVIHTLNPSGALADTAGEVTVTVAH